MRQIAAGRASEIFDLGDGWILRRFREGGDPEREALVMRHAAAHGYPVPRVFDVQAEALVLERISGPTMMEYLRRHPWRFHAQALVLAGLHQRLHGIDAPAPLGPGALLHLDLHPGNVILSPAGPVVIDWTNARGGDPALDLALTWVIGATSGGVLGRLVARTLLAQCDRGEILRALPAAGELRLSDPNVTTGERRAVERLLRSQCA